jgi:hypothetical protein
MPSDDGRGRRECPRLDTSSQFTRNWDLEETRRRSNHNYPGDDLTVQDIQSHRSPSRIHVLECGYGLGNELRVRLLVTTESFILLDKEDYIVRVTIDDADIRLGVLGLSAGEEPQFLASANGSGTMGVSKGVKEGHSKIIDYLPVRASFLR